MSTVPLHYCATLSSEADEPLFGSANYRTRWLILEYSRIWGAQALEESDLPPAVKQRLTQYLDSTPLANLLFIRQHGRHADHLAFYIAEVDPAAPQLYAYHLNSYEDLLRIDFDQPDTEQISDETLFLVCTNAKRDACCATYGLPVYKALRAQVGSQAWMSTHQGGHRFAATALVMPQGIHYGRLREGDAASVVEQTRAGQIMLDKLRGRVCYDKHIQAGEYLWRAEHGLTAIDAVHLEAVESIAPDCWTMHFRANSGTKEIRLERSQTDKEIYTSCTNDKTAFVEHYHLASVRPD